MSDPADPPSLTSAAHCQSLLEPGGRGPPPATIFLRPGTGISVWAPGRGDGRSGAQGLGALSLSLRDPQVGAQAPMSRWGPREVGIALGTLGGGVLKSGGQAGTGTRCELSGHSPEAGVFVLNL